VQSAQLRKRRDEVIERLIEIYPAARRAHHAIRVVRAPGRINLIGEHTDYNDGYVMPAAISLETWIAAIPTTDEVELTSIQLAETAGFAVADPGPRRGTWIDYVAGVAVELAGGGLQLRGVRGVIDSDIPLGAGLSSSAALEIGAAWQLVRDTPPPLESIALAQAAQRAENEYVGVRSGIMDQFAVVSGRTGQALLLDCRSLDWRGLDLPVGHALVALETGSPHELAASEYNARRAQCELGVAALARRHPNVRSLRDVTDEILVELADLVDATVQRRCRHVVAENARVLATAAALERGDLSAIGRLFAESHASLRDLYEVSSTELDALVRIASAVPGVVGARMTGAGFGGCTVNLVEIGAIEPLRQAVEQQYPAETGRQAGFHVVQAVGGAGLVEGTAD
jgi:galactokinase